MFHQRSLGAMTLVAAFMPLAVLAQQTTPATPPGVVATTNNPNLAVAAVKLENGIRASKIIGATVRGDGDQEIGKIDDLVMTEGNKVTVAVVAVGGVLGLGAKLVAFPYDQLKRQGDRITLPGATKDSLNAMPSFQY